MKKSSTSEFSLGEENKGNYRFICDFDIPSFWDKTNLNNKRVIIQSEFDIYE